MSNDARTLIRAVVEPTIADGGDGRTIDVRIVPYNVVARVADPPLFEPYEEMFLPGAFKAQLNAANRVSVLMNYSHGTGIGAVVGRGTKLEDGDDGLYGSFRALDHPDGDKALELVRSGDLTGMSAEFVARRSRIVGGVTQRIDARLANVALCPAADSGYPGPVAAYQGAEVLAVRTQVELEPVVPMAEDTLARLEALGIEPMLERAITRKPWDGSPSRFTDEEYQRSCLIDRGGDAPVKERCSLPVLEPNGDLNVNALGAAAGRLNQVQGASSAQKASAARKLMRYYRQAGMQPPASVTSVARA